MVKVFKHTHRFDDAPQTVLLAFYLRYPNPFASHVLSCDVISRDIDSDTGSISTQRLILKKGIVPRWARTWLENFGMMGGGGLEAWVLEESEVWVDPESGELRLKSMTRNISHKKLMHVTEGTELESAAPFRGTYQHTTALISSNFGSDSRLSSFARGRIENWGAARFEGNSERARQGMSLIMERLRAYQALPNTLEAEESETTSTTTVSADDQERRPHSFYAERRTPRTTVFGSGSNNEEWEEYRPAAHRNNKFTEKYTTGDKTSGSGQSERSAPPTTLPSSFFLSTRSATASTMHQIYPSLGKRFRREEQHVESHDHRRASSADGVFPLRNWQDSEQRKEESDER
ncbi:hypothetical protein QFC21_003891 [Naganishia friedmannii]|uniref:Uncharacterized protein n=1 Tax=Naganishia friedmannii TaxID=89922 RepID=A0ACC2VM71_9TREE|nr:hypothetical protein QFC21_003891 [Naganishia friedmannii]